MSQGNYLTATRHPWPCLLFLLPLLATYEAGVFWLNASQPGGVRNGADTWIRQFLGGVGLNQPFWPPVIVVGILAGWAAVRKDDRPGDLLGVCCGMAVESVVVALGLWAISRSLGPILEQLGMALSLGLKLGLPLAQPAGPSAAAADTQVACQIVTYVGAGIYEELLFRLVLYSGLYGGFRLADVPRPLAVLLGGGVSAALFSAAHHAGPHGEAFDGYVFVFRALAGMYFALVYQLRGFGVAVGGHAFYDVLVGVALG